MSIEICCACGAEIDTDFEAVEYTRFGVVCQECADTGEEYD
jgi:hypothetical protein